ncbi:hypothetical protein [Paenibacillus hamazuiensis]|uniref:hypothetical protein n=1 Tax=Paenibacillus hamazuiensis TaxID=2936508 RepID=UPI002010169E|nr:hypothetical protein [Paenibacillus hamazuiensis]
MKRFLVMSIVAAIVFVLTACSGAAPASKDTPAAGNKVLLVGRDGGGDAITTKRLREVHGFDVKIVSDKEVTSEHANGCVLVFVSESVNSGKIRDKFSKLPVPVIYTEGQSTSDTGMSVTDGYGSLTGGNSAKTIQIKDSKHPLAAGLQNNVDVYKDNGKMGYATPGPEAIVVATVPNEDQKATIFAYEKGVKNAKGDVVTARELFFYMFEGEEINQTEDGWKLFDAAVRWVTSKK